MPPEPERSSFFECLERFKECPYVFSKSTGQVLRVYRVYRVLSDMPMLRVGNLDDSASWNEYSGGLIWLTEMQVLAHVSV